MIPRLVCVAILIGAVTTAGAQTLVPWRHGTVAPKGDAGFFYMAAEGGFAKQQGLDLKMLAFQNDTLMLKALVAGELDTFEGSPISPMIAGAKGADVKILGCSWIKLTYSFFSRPEIGWIRAIVAKTVDAAISTSDFAARPELGLKALAQASEMLPDFVRTCFTTRGDLARPRPEHLVAFMAAEMKAYAHALDSREAVIALARRIAGLGDGDPTPAANFAEVVAHGSVSPLLEIDRAKFNWLRDLLAEDGRLAANFDPAALIDASIRERALARVKAGVP